MKKTLICNITMKQDLNHCVYASGDSSIPVSDRAVVYPVTAFLEKTLQPGDQIKAVLLVKKDPAGNYEKNTAVFKEEMDTACTATGSSVDYVILDTDFEEEKSVHEKLLLDLTNELQTGDHVLADITYGPKDLPVIVFTALNFAEKFLDCSIDNILYGKADFVDGKPINNCICDMLPLFCIGSVTSLIRCNDPERARKMLKTLLSF